MMMALSASANRKLGAILHYVTIICSFAVAIVYTPVMLSKLSGTHEYPVYSFASSVVAYLPLLALGLTSSYLRFYSISKNDGDSEIHSLNGLYLIVFSVIAAVVMIVGSVLAVHSQLFFNMAAFTSEDVDLAKRIIFILTISTAISFPASLFSSFVSSQEKFIFQRLLSLFTSVSTPLVSIIVLFLGGKALAVSIVHLIINVLSYIYLILYCFINLKMRISFRNMRFGKLKGFFVFSIFVAMNTIVDQLNLQTDKIVLTKLTNDYAVSVYSVGSTINSYFMTIGGGLVAVFAPRVNIIANSASLTQEEKDAQTNALFRKVGRMQFILLGVILLGFLFFGRFFVSKWSPGYDDAYYVCLLLMVPMFFYQIQTLSIEMRRARNKHKLITFIYIGTAVLNIIITIPLIRWAGAIGAALGTTISLALNTVLSFLYDKKFINISIWGFWKEIIRLSFGTIPPVLLGCCTFLFPLEWWSFVAFGVVFVLVYFLSMYFIGFNDYERSLVNKMLPFRFSIGNKVKGLFRAPQRKRTIIGIASVLSLCFLVGVNVWLSLATPTPIYISSAEEFAAINNNLSGYYVVKGTVTLDEPIIIGDVDHPFVGTLDGNYTSHIVVRNLALEDYMNQTEANLVYDDSLYFGLFPRNQGTIIHCNFRFEGLNADSSFPNEIENVYCGLISGLNEGKITTCNVSSNGNSLLNIKAASNCDTFFGGLVGKNCGELRTSLIDRSLSFTGANGSHKLFGGGFVGQMENGVFDRCEKRGWLIIGEESQLQNVVFGGFAGNVKSGALKNCFGGSINVGFNNNSNTDNLKTYIAGGFVGNVEPSGSLSISNSCYLGEAVVSSSSPVETDFYAGLLVGRAYGAISANNTLISGKCQVFASTGSAGDIAGDGNCVLVNTYRFKNSTIQSTTNRVLLAAPILEESLFSLSLMKWDTSVWGVSGGKIVFKGIR